jgi:MFS family permease
MSLIAALRGLPREIWVLFVATLVNRAGTMALPFLTLYCTQGLDWSPADAAAVLLAYGLTSVITALPAGRLVDRAGERTVMIASLLISGVVLALYPGLDSLESVMAATIVWSAVNEAFRPASMAVIVKLVRPEQLKTAFAVNRLAINMGMSVGPAAGGFLAAVSYPLLFWVDGATSLAAGAILLAAPWHAPQDLPPHQEQVSTAGVSLREPLLRMMTFMALVLPVVVVFFQHIASMPLFIVQHLHHPEYVYGMLITVNTVLIILIEVPLNHAMAHWSHRRVMMTGAFLFAAGFGGMAFASDIGSLVVTTAVWTFGEMVLLPSMSAYVGELAPPSRRGTFMGLYEVLFGVGFSVAPWIGVTLLDDHGGETLWGCMFLMGCLSAIGMWFLRMTNTRREEG